MRLKTYKLLKCVSGAGEMVQFSEFSAQNPCEQQLSAMYTLCPGTGEVQAAGTLGLASALSVCWVPGQWETLAEKNRAAPVEHPRSFIHWLPHTCTHTNKQMHTCTESNMNYNTVFYCENVRISFIGEALDETSCCSELLVFLWLVIILQLGTPGLIPKTQK